MGKRLQKTLSLRSRGAEFGYGGLLLLFFALGVFTGNFLCDRMDTADELALYLSAFLMRGDAGVSPSAWTAAGLYFRYPIAAFALSLFPAGIFLLPIFLFFAGAELSFSVAAFMAAFGKSGLWAALGTLGIRSALVLPCCFVIACSAFSGRREKAARQTVIFRFLCLGGILGAGICLEIFLVPRLLTRILAGMNF